MRAIKARTRRRHKSSCSAPEALRSWGAPTLLGVVGVYALADCLSLIALALLFRRVAPPAGRPAPELALRRSRSLAARGHRRDAVFRMDIWLLALLRGGRVVGRYSAAYRCFDALLPALEWTSLAIPYTAGTTGEALRRRLQRLVAFSVAITAPFALGIFVYHALARRGPVRRQVKSCPSGSAEDPCCRCRGHGRDQRAVASVGTSFAAGCASLAACLALNVA